MFYKELKAEMEEKADTDHNQATAIQALQALVDNLQGDLTSLKILIDGKPDHKALIDALEEQINQLKVSLEEKADTDHNQAVEIKSNQDSIAKLEMELRQLRVYIDSPIATMQQQIQDLKIASDQKDTLDHNQAAAIQ